MYLIELLVKYQLEKPFKNKRFNERNVVKKAAKDLNYPIDSMLDLINFEVYQTSYQQKVLIEGTYLSEVCEMQDFYFTLDYRDKSRLLKTVMDNLKAELKTFNYEDREIVISFFSERLNTIYLNEIALFELKQYRDLFKDFKEQLVAPTYYGDLVHLNGFSSLKLVASSQNANYFLHEKTNCLVIYSKESIEIFELLDSKLDYDLKLICLYHSQNEEQRLFDYLVEYQLINKKVIKLANKYFKKLAKSK